VQDFNGAKSKTCSS